MRIGILALQGAFTEHKIMLEGLGAECFEIRQLKDLYSGPVNGLVFPGGESTVMDKLLRESGLFSLSGECWRRESRSLPPVPV